MRVLIIGGLGYIGSRLVGFLDELGLDSEIVDIGLYENALLSNAASGTRRFHKALCSDISPHYLRSFDAVIDLSGISNDPVNRVELSSIYHPTMRSSLRLADMCANQGVKYVFASSCSVYGFNEEVVNEKSQCSPLTGYSQNKRDIEIGLDEIAANSNQSSMVSLRFGTIYGYSERMRFDLVLNMFSGMAVISRQLNLNSDGMAWRPHLFIDDACRVLTRIVTDTGAIITHQKAILLNLYVCVSGGEASRSTLSRFRR